MFDEVLRRIQDDLDGTRAVLLVDRDGMVVSAASRDKDAPLELIAASYMDIARRLARANEEAEMEAPRELMVTGPFGSALFRSVTEDYGLLALVGPEGILGRTRFELRKAGVDLLPELET